MEPLNDTGPDPLARLEERIHKAVDLIPQLRAEKDEAEQARDTAIREVEEAQTMLQQLTQEVQILREEREQVRNRIEKLLGQMELLS